MASIMAGTCALGLFLVGLSVASVEQDGRSMKYSRRLRGLGSDCWGRFSIAGCDFCVKISCEPRCVSSSPPEATGEADCVAVGGATGDDECIGNTKSFASPDSVSSSSTARGTNGSSTGDSEAKASGGPGSIAHMETKVDISEGRLVASSSSIVVSTG